MVNNILSTVNIRKMINSKSNAIDNLFAKYKMWCEKLEKCSKEYESKYGPLCYTKGNNYNSFKWVNGSWPWESEDGKYV